MHIYTHAEMSYLKFLSKLLVTFISLGWNGHVKVLTLLLTQQLKPVYLYLCMCVRCVIVRKKKESVLKIMKT